MKNGWEAIIGMEVQVQMATETKIFKTYESTYIIIDLSSTTTRLKGIVTNSADGIATSVTIVELLKTVTTDSQCKYPFKSLAIVTYTVGVTATGFNNFEADEVNVKLGAVNNLDVKLGG
jgi:hypothetical protein